MTPVVTRPPSRRRREGILTTRELVQALRGIPRRRGRKQRLPRQHQLEQRRPRVQLHLAPSRCVPSGVPDSAHASARAEAARAPQTPSRRTPVRLERVAHRVRRRAASSSPERAEVAFGPRGEDVTAEQGERGAGDSVDVVPIGARRTSVGHASRGVTARSTTSPREWTTRWTATARRRRPGRRRRRAGRLLPEDGDDGDGDGDGDRGSRTRRRRPQTRRDDRPISDAGDDIARRWGRPCERG